MRHAQADVAGGEPFTLCRVIATSWIYLSVKWFVLIPGPLNVINLNVIFQGQLESTNYTCSVFSPLKSPLLLPPSLIPHTLEGSENWIESTEFKQFNS